MATVGVKGLILLPMLMLVWCGVGDGVNVEHTLGRSQFTIRNSDDSKRIQAICPRDIDGRVPHTLHYWWSS